MLKRNLLYKTEYRINDFISVRIPKVGEILSNETQYYSLVTAITAMPIDFMVQLDDMGIDFTAINEYELFLILFQGMQDQDASLVFGDLDLKKFHLAENTGNGEIALVDRENDIVIDRAIHNQIATALREIHHLEKDIRKPANIEAKSYIIDRERAKQKRRKSSGEGSQLEPLIVAMVNTEQYKYDYESTRDLTIYQFNESVMQIVKKIDYDNRMIGVYAGTVNVKEISQDDLNWLIHK